MRKQSNQKSNVEQAQNNSFVIDNDTTLFEDQIGQSQDDEDGWSDDDILVDEEQVESQNYNESDEEAPVKESAETDDRSVKSDDLTDDQFVQILKEVSNFPVDINTFVPNDFSYKSDGIIPTRKRFISSSERLRERIENIS